MIDVGGMVEALSGLWGAPHSGYLYSTGHDARLLKHAILKRKHRDAAAAKADADQRCAHMFQHRLAAAADGRRCIFTLNVFPLMRVSAGSSPMQVNLKRKHWGAAGEEARAGQRCAQVFQRQLAAAAAGAKAPAQGAGKKRRAQQQGAQPLTQQGRPAKPQLGGNGGGVAAEGGAADSGAGAARGRRGRGFKVGPRPCQCLKAAGLCWIVLGADESARKAWSPFCFKARPVTLY